MQNVLPALTVFFAACAAPPSTGPFIHLTGDVTPGMLDGAAQWEQVGFSTAETDVLPECSPRWYVDGDFDCTITIAVEVRFADGFGGWANFHTRTIVIDPVMLEDAYLLQSIAAHEVGHIILDSGVHLDFQAVMNLSRVSATVTASDKILACSSVGMCVEGLTPNPTVHPHDDGVTR